MDVVSKSQVDKAGKILRDANASGQERQAAIATVASWRKLHATPLIGINMLMRRVLAKKSYKDAIIAQRLKRMPSIVEKLFRYPQMGASRMQDIGGVRIIVDSIQDVRDLNESLYDLKRSRHQLQEPAKDYIANPKADGYRSLHRVFRYVGTNKLFHGLHIELQIRTRLQHAWATAVETLGLIEGTSFKTGYGDKSFKRFFRLASALFSLDEGQPLVEACRNYSAQELVREFNWLDNELQATARLDNLTVTTPRLEKLDGAMEYDFVVLWLKKLSSTKARLFWQGFRKDNDFMAESLYKQLEQESANDPSVSVVLVSTRSVLELKKAYPNYYLDASLFLENIRRVCRKYA